MRYLYSRIPAAAVYTSIDGHRYANIPHRYDPYCQSIVECFERPRMVRFCSDSFVLNGEAFVLFAKLGDAIELSGRVLFSVSIVERD